MRFFLSILSVCTAAVCGLSQEPTREFEVRGDRAFLGGQPFELWGLRCGNALHSESVTERHVRALDNMVAHGINAIAVYVQGSNGGWPDEDAAADGYGRDGSLSPAFAARLERLVRECDRRGMVVCVGLFSPRKDQRLEGEAAVRRAVEETARFLQERRLRNVFVDLMHEFDHTERADQPLLREPDGAAKKAKLAAWFHGASEGIEVGCCPYEKSPTGTTFAGMDVRIVQKSMAIPAEGWVVNVESQKRDAYQNDGVFAPGGVEAALEDCERYLAAPNAAMFFHAAYVQGIGNFSGTAPHPEMGGTGSTAGNRGVRFYFEWVRDHVGRWQYPKHVPYAADAVAAASPAPTREFEVRDERAFLGGQPVRLWGLRCNNSLLSPAVTERLINNLDNMAAHGINLVSVSLQGTNGGFPDVDAGPNAFTPNGDLIIGFAKRLERVIRECDRRGMVVLVIGMMPRKDELLRDEAAVRKGIEDLATLLESRGLRNVMVNLFQEFHHPTRIDHDIFREPFGDAKKAQLTAWFKAIAPNVEVGIVPNHLNGSRPEYPGCDIVMIHEGMPIPERGFIVNTETPDQDLSGDEGVFTAAAVRNLERMWAAYAAQPRVAMLFRSCFVEDVRGAQGTGPNLEMGGLGKGAGDRGVRRFYEWSLQHLGRWEYPVHVR
jgi:sugar phosphate isomerase/epimerase